MKTFLTPNIFDVTRIQNAIVSVDRKLDRLIEILTDDLDEDCDC